MDQRRTTWFGKLPLVRAYLMRVRDPIIADRSLDLMCAAYWMCLSTWGIVSAIIGLPTVSLFTSDIYEKVWGGAIGASCLMAFTCAIATFFNNPNITHRINLKRAEMVASAVAGGFIAVYPALLAIAVLTVGDLTRFATFFAALTYVIIPIWRTRHLSHRIAKLRQIQEDMRRGLA